MVKASGRRARPSWWARQSPGMKSLPATTAALLLPFAIPSRSPGVLIPIVAISGLLAWVIDESLRCRDTTRGIWRLWLVPSVAIVALTTSLVTILASLVAARDGARLLFIALYCSVSIALVRTVARAIMRKGWLDAARSAGVLEAGGVALAAIAFAGSIFAAFARVGERSKATIVYDSVVAPMPDGLATVQIRFDGRYQQTETVHDGTATILVSPYMHRVESSLTSHTGVSRSISRCHLLRVT